MFCFQAADEFALFIIGNGAIAEGVKVKELAGRIRVAYEALPQKGYKCPKGQVRTHLHEYRPVHLGGSRAAAQTGRNGLNWNACMARRPCRSRGPPRTHIAPLHRKSATVPFAPHRGWALSSHSPG
jgi:hypothetical protein